MRKIIFIVTLAILSQVALAQNSVYNTQPESLFNQGKEMFLGGNWNGAVDFLQKFSSETNDMQLKEEAEYMIVASIFLKGNEKSDLILKEFLEKYPETVHVNQINFFIASFYFDKGEWSKALLWFNLADLDYLKLHEQEDYSFRTGYTHLKLGNMDEAKRYFGLLSLNSAKYRDSSNFYLGYIDYSNGDYRSALNRFESLKNHPEYEEEISFYTAQATFYEGRIDEAIRLSEAYLQRYPHSTHTTELNRILGNSYYRLGQPTRAIPYYEKYMYTAEKPLRGDAYFMGLSYFESAKYNEALKLFQQSVGESDELTQNAQLQLGHTYLKLNQKQQAQMAFEAASRLNYSPQVRETAMFNYALLSHETNFSVFSESISLFENFLREFPDSQYKDQVNDILAETFLTTKDYRAALNAMNRINNPGRRILEAKQMVLFQLGAQDFINGNMSDAIQNFNNSIALGNINPQARNSSYYWRGETYYRMGSYTNAASDFRQFTQSATSADANWALGWYNLGYSHFKQQQHGQAVDAFQKYISSETDRKKTEYADALNRIGDSYYFNRNFTDAERYYTQAADVNPEAAEYAAYQRAFVMGLQHNFQGKVNALDNLMSKYPNSQYFDDALYEKSRALTMMNRVDDAIAVLQKLLNEFPKSPLASQGGVQLGQLYYNSNNFQQSINAYKSVISNFPGSDDARSALVAMETVYRDMNDVESYVDYANSLPGGLRITTSKQDSLTYLAAESVYMRGNRTEAESALNRYLQSYPNGAYSSDAYYYMAVISDEKNNKDQALSYFRRVIDAGNVKYLDNALIYTSQTEYQNGNYREALADYSRLANSARNATNKQIGQLGVVRTQSQLSNHHEAARAATDLLSNSSLSPETITEVRYLRGKAYQQINEADNAVQDFQFVANDTRSIYGAEAQFILADTFYRWKSYDRAEAQVKEFMQKGTPHQYWMARALIVLSDTYIAKGDEFQAKQYIESLKNNYKGTEADIQQMINERLR